MDIVYKKITSNGKGIAQVSDTRFHGEIYFTVVLERRRVSCQLSEFIDSWILKIDGRTDEIDLAGLSDTFWNSEQIMASTGNEAEACAIASAIHNIYEHQMDIL